MPRVQRFSAGRFQPMDLPVVEERPLALYVNGQELVTLLCTPSKLEALVVGFLSFEGIIRGLGDVWDLTVLEAEGFADVRLTADFVPPRRRVHTSGCGAGSPSRWRRRRRPPCRMTRRSIHAPSFP